MVSRKAVRQALVTLFANQGFNQVNGFAPTDLQGYTKVLNIYSSKSRKDIISKDLQNDFYLLNLDVFVKRTNSSTDEDDLDDLHDVIGTVIEANISNANWSHLDLLEDSDAIFAELSGVPYRLERHNLLVKVSS